MKEDSDSTVSKQFYLLYYWLIILWHVNKMFIRPFFFISCLSRLFWEKNWVGTCRLRKKSYKDPFLTKIYKCYSKTTTWIASNIQKDNISNVNSLFKILLNKFHFLYIIMCVCVLIFLVSTDFSCEFDGFN